MDNFKEIYKSDNFTIIEGLKNEEIIRLIKTDNSYQSVSYCGKNKFELYDEYSKLYDICALDKNKNTSTLVLGGGGFSYPKYYISKYKNKTMDVVEISKEYIDISFKYFCLDDLYNQFDKNKERLNIINDSAQNYIDNCKKKYNCIFLDCYYDEDIDNIFLSDEFTKKVKECLIDEKCYLINFLVIDGFDKFNKYIDILKNNFKYVNCYTVSDHFHTDHGNICIVCSDESVKIDVNIEYINVLIS